jgi:electron transport complex protein RnfC
LLPQQLYWYASSRNIDRLVEHNIFDCIECGCCAYVCPSDIPLVQYYRYAKTSIWQQERERKHSDIARERHEAHQARLEKQKQEREEKLRKKREMLAKRAKDKPGDKKQDAIAEALARAQAKKAARASQGEAAKKGENDQDDNSKDKEAQ